jgi:menaquinone-dependent protoporphyrinogen oxidase
MRVLVTWGSKRGGTEGLARIVAETLGQQGFDVELVPAEQAGGARSYDAVIIGGALYANRWHPAARRFVARHEKQLQRVPVWFFSSGPLDETAERRTVEPTRQVEVLMERVGALGHVTFGGRLLPDARGFPASAMAKKHAGDWRNPERVQAWATDVARAIPTARPGAVTPQPARAVSRLILHAAVGWALCAAIMGPLLALTTTTAAIVVHAVAAPLVFWRVATLYFRAHGARDPLPTAVVFVTVAAVLDFVIVAGVLMRSLAMFRSFAGTWLPLALIFVVTWAVGEVMTMMPSGPSPTERKPQAGRHAHA